MKLLFGCGNCGRSIARDFTAKGIPFAFVDNDPAKQYTLVLGVDVLGPEEALAKYPNAEWIVSIGKPEAEEVVQQLRAAGIEPEIPWEYLGLKLGLPPKGVQGTIASILSDEKSLEEWCDQYDFREHQDYAAQEPCEPLADIYFPDFIAKRDDEHFVDCGAADGDTVAEFLRRWKSWTLITAFEPDKGNYEKLRDVAVPNGQWIDTRWKAVGDARQVMAFQAYGDYSSHLSTHVSQPATTMVECVKLDDAELRTPPTFIKMDIEGSELEALWGARRILKEHSPVLAICAYHTSDHLWQIPLLIHAIQPDYKLFLRRYSPGTMDLVWYAVPPDRIKT